MTNLLLFILGLAALVIGAELLVRGSSQLARRLGLSPLVIGLTVVAYGTSAPEAAVSVDSALNGNTALTIGNVVGSNIFNLLCILGLSAVITPLVVHSQIVRQELPIMIGTGVLLLVLSLNDVIGWWEGVLLLLCLVAYTVFLIVQARRSGQDEAEDLAPDQVAATRTRKEPLGTSIGLSLMGLLGLVLGADWLVESCVVFAQQLGVSDLIIGLTIMAAGTSLPELAASLAAAVKGQRDLAVGNVVGSCTFNILGCLGIAAIVAPEGLAVPPAVMSLDIWVMLATFLACLPAFMGHGQSVSRWKGALFLGYYVLYLSYLVLAAQSHDALEPFSNTLIGIVIPLTIITLVISLVHGRASVKP